MMNPNMAAANMNNPWATSGAQPNPQQLEQTLQMLENPAVASMMDQMLQQNPQALQQMMQSNPQYQAMAQQNPMMAQLMQDPNFVRSMMNPQTIRAMMQMQQSMGGGGMNMMPPMGNSMSGATTGNAAGNQMDFSQLLNSFQSTGLGGASQQQQQQQAPADRYRVQLASLRDMGFDDEMASIRALEMHHGNVNRAIDYLLTSPGAAVSPAPASSGTGSGTGSGDAADESASSSTGGGTDEAPAAEEPKGSDDKKND